MRFCNIPHLGVFLASLKILWPVAISMDLIRIVGVLVTLFSFFIRGVVVFKGLEIEQFLFTVNLGRNQEGITKILNFVGLTLRSSL